MITFLQCLIKKEYGKNLQFSKQMLDLPFFTCNSSLILSKKQSFHFCWRVRVSLLITSWGRGARSFLGDGGGDPLADL